MIDIDSRWLAIYAHTAKQEGNHHLSISLFRHRWEFGYTCDWHETGPEMLQSRYYLYLEHLDSENALINAYEFPRKNRWSHVTG